MLLLGRILFSIIFISSGLNHFINFESTREYAAAKGVPFPSISNFISGSVLLAGGISILLGLWVNVGALLLVLFLLPAAFLIHDFWKQEEPQARQNEQIHFMKNLAMAGGALFIWYIATSGLSMAWAIQPAF